MDSGASSAGAEVRYAASTGAAAQMASSARAGRGAGEAAISVESGM